MPIACLGCLLESVNVKTKECALKVSECVCVITRSQGKGNQETQGDRTLVSTNEFSGDSSMATGTGLGGSLDSGVMHNDSTQCKAGCSYQSANGVHCRSSTSKNNFLRSNWTDRWSLDELRQLQHQDDDIRKLLKLKSDGSEKPLKAGIRACSSQYRILCVQ